MQNATENAIDKARAFAFKTPDLSAFPTTDREVKTAHEFTRIREIVMDGYPDAHTVWLAVGNQSFRLDPECDTAEDAAWVCWMLAKALINVQSAATEGK